MNEEEQAGALIVPSFETWCPYYPIYSVYSRWDGENIRFSPQELLDIAAYVETNRGHLEQEAQKEIQG